MKTRLLLPIIGILVAILKRVFAKKNQSSGSISSRAWSSILKNFECNYLFFFDGPGIMSDNHLATPNPLANGSHGCLMLNINLCLKYFLIAGHSLDLKARTQYVFNNGTGTENFDSFRWQSPQFGISTTFLKHRIVK